MRNCGVCSHYLAGGDFGLCCELKYDLCYESSDACEKFDPMECPRCDEVGSVRLDKYPSKILWQGKQVSFERWTYRCEKCGNAFEPGWMFNQNLGRIHFAYALSGEEVANV